MLDSNERAGMAHRRVRLAPWVHGSRWPSAARIVRTVVELRTFKRQPGKNIYVVGGATLVASLLNEDLIDELRLIVHPVVLGSGQALFGGVNKRLSLDLIEAKSTESGRVIVSYRNATRPTPLLTGSAAEAAVRRGVAAGRESVRS